MWRHILYVVEGHILHILHIVFGTLWSEGHWGSHNEVGPKAQQNTNVFQQKNAKLEIEASTFCLGGIH